MTRFACFACGTPVADPRLPCEDCGLTLDTEYQAERRRLLEARRTR